jgi:dihydroxyacid dehydratase/phosphogluconate dehydratase
LQDTLLKKDDEIFELQKQNKKLAGEVDDWKLEARRNRRIELDQKQTKETNDFLTEFNKLQQAKIQGGSR